MSDRDRLSWLIKNALAAYGSEADADITPQDFIADFLLSSGVKEETNRWNEDGRCSVCDWYMPFDCEGNAFETDYCPHCGTKMNGEQQSNSIFIYM